MGCVPSKAKVLRDDAGPHAASPPASGNDKKSMRTKKTNLGPASPVTMENPPPWLQARAKMVVEQDGSVQFKPHS